MARRFDKLTRKALRAMKPRQRIIEHGITAECLANGDIRYSVNVMVDGQRIHRVIGRESDRTTRTQAEEFIEQKRTEAREGRLSLPKGRKVALTFSAAADLYLKKLEQSGGKDLAKNREHLRRHLKPYFGRQRADRISTFTLQKYQRYCREKGLAESTINNTLATYRRMGRRLHEWGELAASPAMIKLKPVDNRRSHVISVDEEARLVKAALDDSHTHIWLFIKIAFATSLRRNEILFARFGNFDPVRRRLRTKVKGGRWRGQPLTRGIVEILERERKMADDPEGWIFPSTRAPGGHMTHINGPFTRCVDRAGLDLSVVTPHAIRHTAITRLANTGAGVRTLQEFSGHQSIAMVMRYVHAQDEIVNRALDDMEGGTIEEHPASRKSQRS
jgi:integrase